MADPFDYWPDGYWPSVEVTNSASFSANVVLLAPESIGNVAIHSDPLLTGDPFTAVLLDENGLVVNDINILDYVSVTATTGTGHVIIESIENYDFGGARITAIVDGSTRTYLSASAVPNDAIITFFDTPDTVATVCKFSFPITYSVDGAPGTEGTSNVYLMVLNDYSVYATQLQQLLGLI